MVGGAGVQDERGGRLLNPPEPEPTAERRGEFLPVAEMVGPLPTVPWRKIGCGGWLYRGDE
jgi:hypothetical protein